MTTLPALGRLPTEDPTILKNNRRYLMPKRGSPRTYRMWPAVTPHDQGETSQCVAYSAFHYLLGSPHRQSPISVWRNQEALYHACQKADEWPGEDYDGTSVHACASLLKQAGFISEYRWAYELAPVVAWLLDVGPVMVGTSWYRDMFMPTRAGYILDTGPDEGGHAYLLVGCNTRKRNPNGSHGAVRILNSWGMGWGDRGRAWMSFDMLGRLIAADGEACVATEVKR